MFTRSSTIIFSACLVYHNTLTHLSLEGGGMSAGKGDKPRPIDRKGWENSKLWDNIDKKKLEQAQKEGRIKILKKVER